MRHSTRNSQLCLKGDACLLQKQAAREAVISEDESVFDENLKKDSAAQAAFRTDARAGSEAAIKERKRPRSNEADFILRRGMEYFRARAHTYRRVDTILVWNAVRIDPRPSLG